MCSGYPTEPTLKSLRKLPPMPTSFCTGVLSGWRGFGQAGAKGIAERAFSGLWKQGYSTHFQPWVMGRQ